MRFLPNRTPTVHGSNTNTWFTATSRCRVRIKIIIPQSKKKGKKIVSYRSFTKLIHFDLGLCVKDTLKIRKKTYFST